MTAWQHAPSVAWVDDDADRVVALDLADLTGLPLVLTDSAAAIWRAVDGRGDTDAVVAAVAAGFGLAPGDVAADVSAFLDDLEARGLVSRAKVKHD